MGADVDWYDFRALTVRIMMFVPVQVLPTEVMMVLSFMFVLLSHV